MGPHLFKSLILPAGISLLLAGCADNLISDSPLMKDFDDPISLSGKIDQEYVSRASDDGFAEGDCMGVFIVDYVDLTPGKLTVSSNRANNALFQLKGTDWVSTRSYYWKDKTTKVDVYGYYPYSNAIVDVNEMSFEVAYDQRPSSDDEMGGYEASDFLWAKAAGVSPTTERIVLNYTHRLAGCMVTLNKGEGISDTEWEKIEKAVAVDNVTRFATIDLEKGSVTATSAPDRQIAMADQNNGTYRAVVVPQTVEASVKLFSITIDGTSYAYVRTSPLTLEAGKLYRFTLKIDKSNGGDYSVKLVSEEIIAWENDNLTHNFSEYEYTTVTVSEPGTLKAAIEAMGKKYAEIKNLKIVGPITTKDFDFMREEMAELAMLNLKEAKCKDIEFWEWNHSTGQTEMVAKMDNAIPNDAFYGKRTLRRITFSDDTERIGSGAFREIGLDVNSSVILPSKLKRVGDAAFGYNPEGGELIMNENLEYIGSRAFGSNFRVCQFKLTDKVKHIGSEAFYGVQKVNGSFYMPSKIEHLSNAFDGMAEFDGVGEISVPENIHSIHTGMLPGFSRGVNLILHDNIKEISSSDSRGGISDQKILNRVSLPEGLTTLGVYAFGGTYFAGGLTLPSTLRILEERAFMYVRGISELNLPEGIEVIPSSCFQYSDLKKLVLPNSVLQIRAGAFKCDLQELTIGKNCTYIGEGTFSGALRSLICLNPEPPTLDGLDKGEGAHPFGECNLDHLVLQVPEKSVELYRNTPGWNRIRYITAYHELAVGVSEITALDAGLTYETLVRAEGAWEVSECPSWVEVTPQSSDIRRTDVVIKVKPTSQGTERTGRIVFRLKEKGYTTYTDVKQLAYEHPEDKEIVFHKASAGGAEIPVLFVGEGFDAQSIADGTYMTAMQNAYEHFFAIEPYKTYKEYFSASTAVAVSADAGIMGVLDGKSGVKFDSMIDDYGYSINWDKVRAYGKGLDSKFNRQGALIVVVPNYNAFFGMTDLSESDASVAVCGLSPDIYPYDFRGIVQHFACGAAFGRLAPEYVSHYEFIRGCRCGGCNGLGELQAGYQKGWYRNVSLSGAMNSVAWSHLIFDPRYSDIVDVYEGAYRHLRGAFRSENQSCMSTYIQYFNTISRQLIVERILSLAGEDFTFEKFVQKDSREGCPEQFPSK